MVVDVTGEEQRHVYTTRVEQWEPDDRAINAAWPVKPGETLDWSFTEFATLRLVLATQYFKTGSTYNPNFGWDRVAQSDALDLAGLAPVWAAVRAAHEDDLARANETNLNCVWAY